MKINFRITSLLYLQLFTLLIYITARIESNVNAMFICGFILMIATLITYSIDYERNIAYLLFVTSCFLFTQGMYFINLLVLGNIQTGFSNDITIHILDCIMISYISLNFGYSIGNPRKDEVDGIYALCDVSETTRVQCIRDVSLLLCRISALLYIADLIDVIIFVRENSYLDYYTSYTTHLPRILQVLGHMYIAFIWIYLSTCPKKTECTRKILIYVIISFLVLLTGDRGGFIQNIGILIVYAFWRQTQDREVWISKAFVLMGILLLPLFLASMSYFVFLREGIEVGEATVSVQLQRFVSRTGNSAGVIGYEKVYHDFFPKENYIFGSLIDYLIYNPVTQMFGLVKPRAQTAEFALNMHSFESALSFFVFPESYLRGHGIGSSYIAEAYHDYSYPGVFLINIVYGIVLRRYNTTRQNDPLKFALLLLIVRAMFYAPRGPALVPLTSVLNITIVSAFISVYILSRFIEPKNLWKKDHE